MGSKDTFRLMSEETAGKWVGIGAFLFLAAYVLTSTWDYAAALEAEAVEKEERAVQIINEALEESGRFSHPIEWQITITQSGPGIREPRTYYARAKQ